jgi:hypothetical protein
VLHAACLQHGNSALEASVHFYVLELDDVVGRERNPVAGELGGAQQVGDLHVHVERDPLGPEVLRDGVDELLEAPVGGHSKRHARHAVEHGALHVELLDLLPGSMEKAVGRQLDGRGVAEREQPALLERGEIPAEAQGDPAKLVGRLLQREEDPGLPALGALEQEAQAEQGLSGARPALDHGRARARQPAPEHRIEPVDARGHALGQRDGFGRAGFGASHAREEGEPVLADLEEVAAGHVVRPAQLQDFHLADGGQLVPPIGEADDAVGDRELGVGRDFPIRVLAHEEARRSPGRGVDRQVVDEGPDRRGLVEALPDRLEAVDHDDRRLLALDALRDRLERGFRPFPADHGAEVGEDDSGVDLALVEEGELLHVVDELQRRLGEGREIQAFPALARQVKHHLQREQGLARAGLAREHHDGADREPTSEDLIEVGAARGEPLQAGADRERV